MIRALLVSLCLVLPLWSQTPKTSTRTTAKRAAQPAAQHIEPSPPDAKSLEGVIALLKDGYEYHSCLNSDLTNGPLPSPDPRIGGTHPMQAELYAGLILHITDVVAEPYNGVDGGYRLFLQFVDDKSAIYHGQVWMPPINNGVYLSPLRSYVIKGMSFSPISDPFRGIQTPQRGMTRANLDCHFVAPEAVNDYGDGQEQWVFYGGSLLVYLTDSQVSNVQRFSH